MCWVLRVLAWLRVSNSPAPGPGCARYEGDILTFKKLYVSDLNIWYDVRTGYIHEHIRNIRHYHPLPYDQSHEEDIEDQEQNKSDLHDELRDLIEESNETNFPLFRLITLPSPF